MGAGIEFDITPSPGGEAFDVGHHFKEHHSGQERTVTLTLENNQVAVSDDHTPHLSEKLIQKAGQGGFQVATEESLNRLRAVCDEGDDVS